MRPIKRHQFAQVPIGTFMATGGVVSALGPSGKAPATLAGWVPAGATFMRGPALLSDLEDG